MTEEAKVSPFGDREVSVRSKKPLERAIERGAAEIFEAAFVLGMLLTLLIGVLFLARAFSIYQTLTRAAQDAARAAALPSGVTTAYTCTAGTSGTTFTIVQNSLNASLDAAGVNSAGVTGLTVSCDAQINAGSSLNEPEVKLTFTYPYTIQLPLYGASLTFTINGQAKQEN